ncbi:beta chain spectrin [Culex quinquefasciatus]|uniref:Beta chain spectrin n=1 Tax=Culex quinquefasciatus TaxID=7176 RepID=B0XAL5_CULQU|nr:beta chain spectrin [Culex quinquefasciatus]|eukprot:XP_001866687.1 beta chain spectrin [Culex quinquefasciatus]
MTATATIETTGTTQRKSCKSFGSTTQVLVRLADFFDDILQHLPNMFALFPSIAFYFRLPSARKANICPISSLEVTAPLDGPNKSCLALFHRPINRFRSDQQQCRWWLQVVEPSDRSGYAKNVLYLWNYLQELLRARRMRLEFSIHVWRMLTPNFANWPSSVVPGWKGAASCGSSTRTWSLKRTGSKRKHCFYRRDWSRFDHRHRRFLLFKHKPLEKEINSHEQQLIAVSTVRDELMLDVLRLVSSEDVGRDEQNVQILLKKHKHVADELKNYAETIELLHTQAKNLALIEPEQQKNQAYSKLREQAEGKRDDLKSAHSMQTFYIECRETISWIEDKKRILPKTDDLLMELTGVTTLQRRLSGTECNLAASQAKLTVLERGFPTEPERDLLLPDRYSCRNPIDIKRPQDAF